MSIYEVLSALGLTQSVHAKVSIGMHWGIKFGISRVPLMGLETRLGWRTDGGFLRNPSLNEINVYADVYDYEYKELSIPFWSTCLSSPLKYFMGVWSFVIVYFQNEMLLKCTSLSFFILYWYWFVVTLTIRFLNITYFESSFLLLKKVKCILYFKILREKLH